MEQVHYLAYKLQYVLIGSLVIVFGMVLIWVIWAGVGATNAQSTEFVTDSSLASPIDSPNVISTGLQSVSNSIGQTTDSTWRSTTNGLQTVATVASGTAKSIGHSSAVVADSTLNGVAFLGRGASSGLLFNLRLPGKAAASVFHTFALSPIIRPAKSAKVPVIDGRTSAAMLANYNVEQQRAISKLLAGQLSANQNLDGSIVAGDPNHGGYPSKWDHAPQDSRLDSWGMYNRECVSYVAWKAYKTFGFMPYWGGVGNANQWIRDAKNSGIPTGSTPKVHSAAISMSGYYGHAMWVEAVKGNRIYVSQYNYDLNGRYSEMWVNGSRFTYIYFK